MSPAELCHEAARRGLRLESRADKLAVIPANRCTPEFADTLRAHKSELLDWFEARAAGLPRTCAPWLHVARQILAGEFDGSDKSTVESLKIGLRSVLHPDCYRALNRLKATRRSGGTRNP
jgi:hypothetical protein